MVLWLFDTASCIPKTIKLKRKAGVGSISFPSAGPMQGIGDSINLGMVLRMVIGSASLNDCVMLNWDSPEREPLQGGAIKTAEFWQGGGEIVIENCTAQAEKASALGGGTCPTKK